MMSNKNCFVLVADGFAENSIAQTAEFFSDTSMNPVLVSLYLSQNVQNLAAAYGMSTALLSDVQHWELPEGLLLAGGLVCGQHLMIDPRVYHLIQEMYLAERPVGLLHPVYIPFVEAVNLLPGPNQILFQERFKTEMFLQNFARQMNSLPTVYPPQPAYLIF